MSLADRIAYDLHDLEDGLGAKLIDPDELASMPLWRDARSKVDISGGSGNVHSIRRPVIDLMLNTLFDDLLSRASNSRPKDRQGLPRPAKTAPPDLPQFTTACDAALRQLEAYLSEKVYHHLDVAGADAEGHQMIEKLFSAYMKNPGLLPDRFADRIAEQGAHRVICDYIAGMSDSFCSSQYAKLCPPSQ